MRADPPVARAIGGVSVDELARAYGTPLLAIDGEILDANLSEFARAARELGIEISYAAKALFFVALAKRVAAAGLGIDVCSLGELATAERAGVAASRLTLHGCGKSDDELRAALAGRVGRLVADGLDEIARLAALPAGPAPLDVLVRVNTGVEAHTHAYVRTGGEDSKFGVSLAEVDAALDAVAAAPGLRLRGIHTHIGSQIFENAAFGANLPLALDAFAAAAARSADARDLVLGGGFGVDAHPGGERFDAGGLLLAMVGELPGLAAERGIRAPHLGFEPGRAVVAAAGSSLYRVVAVKRHATRSFAIVDGSLADNPRPALYGAYHHPALASRHSTAEPTDFVVSGRSCESDTLVEAQLPADLAPGDLLTLGTTGAYTYSMASNYNRFPRPAVVFAERGTHRAAVRRESIAELLACDLDDSA